MDPTEKRHDALAQALRLDAAAPSGQVCSIAGVLCILVAAGLALYRGQFVSWLILAGVTLVVGGQIVAAINAAHRRIALVYYALADVDAKLRASQDRQQVMQLALERLGRRLEP